jgi:hypothetical protein
MLLMCARKNIQCACNRTEVYVQANGAAGHCNEVWKLGA